MFKALATFEAEQTPDAAEPVRPDLAKLDGELARLATAVAQGGALETLLVAIQTGEQRRAELRAALAKQERQQARQRGRDEVLTAVRQAVADWKTTLRADVPSARRALQALLGGRLVFTRSPAAIGSRAPGRSSPSSVAWCQKVAVRGRALSRPRYGARSIIETAVVASRAAPSVLDRAITFGTGPKEARRPCRIWLYCVAGIIGRFTRRAIRSRDSPTASLQFRRPDGELLSEVPAGDSVTGDPVKRLRARHSADGVVIDPRTAMPRWLGERLNLGWAIDVSYPFENPDA